MTYSLTAQPAFGGKSRLLFSGPSAGRRIKGQVAMSYDNGKTWPVKNCWEKEVLPIPASPW